MLKVTVAIEASNAWQKSEAIDFKDLYEANWNSLVSSVASRRKQLRQINKNEVLPLTDDMTLLADWLEGELGAIQDKDMNHVTKVTLARILLFNKVRTNEVCHIKVEDYNASENDIMTKEVLDSLDVVERNLAKRLQVIQVRGKSTRGIRKVHVIITPSVKRAIDYILLHRSSRSKYIFSNSAGRPMNGCAVLKEILKPAKDYNARI